ncbi:MAG: M15 family metallopeptidase [Actinomycetota bacterium]|nr:M15 family metallopeptidase [Actinomycetota bacterium]
MSRVPFSGTAAVLALSLLAAGCSSQQPSSPTFAAPVDTPATSPANAAIPETTSTTAVEEVATEATADRGSQPRPAAPKKAASVPPPSTSQPTPAFRGSAQPIDAATRSRMTSSWRPGCPVPIEDLRLLSLDHWGFDGGVRRGELVVHRGHAGRVLAAMGRLFEARFPIERMELVDAYGGDDDRSMAANNTSAFNCRAVSGRPGVWSQHSYGWAVDVNPVQNPFMSGGRVSPPAGATYANRSARRPGMIHSGDAAVRAFASVGWGWGGNWGSSKDYQHFSATGR